MPPAKDVGKIGCEAAANDTSESPSRGGHVSGKGRSAQPYPLPTPHPTVVRTLWRLARTFLDLQDLFDERPRGGLAAGCPGAPGMESWSTGFVCHDVRIRDQGDAENSGVGQRVEGDADVARVYRGGHYG